MAISMSCPGCQTRFDFEDDLRGKRIRCQSCSQIFRVEASLTPVAPPPKPAPKPTSSASINVPPPPKSTSSPAVNLPPITKPPAPVGRKQSTDDDDDDRPARRSRPVDDEDDERPQSRSRNDDDEDEDDRPRSRRRDREDDDDVPRSRYRDRDDDSGDDLPTTRKKKLNPLLIAGPIVGLLVVVVVAVLLTRGKKKPQGDSVASANNENSCVLEVPAKDISFLVVPDSGTKFGIVRNLAKGSFGKDWVFEAYDMKVGRRTGKVELREVSEPLGATMSPDGKYLLVTDKDTFDSTLLLYSIADGKCLTPTKWQPFPQQFAKHDLPKLFRAEFVGPDKVLTMSNSRLHYVYQVPSFEGSRTDTIRATGKKLDDHWNWTFAEPSQRGEFSLAFTADRKRFAVWNGDGYSIVDPDAGEQFRTPSINQKVAALSWRGDAEPGPVAFSPDGRKLAGLVAGGFGRQDVLFNLWSGTESNDLTGGNLLPEWIHNGATRLRWWGNRFVLLSGLKSLSNDVEGVLFDTEKGNLVRQLMSPEFRKFTLGRDGRLWYAVSENRTDNAVIYVATAPPPESLLDGDPFETVPGVKEPALRRLWMEPSGVVPVPTRYGAPLTSGLIRRR